MRPQSPNPLSRTKIKYRLDLNMPVKDGREVLKEIKGDPELNQIPIVVLTTSSLAEDVVYCYDQGENSYIIKPFSPAKFGTVVENLWDHWFETVRLPSYAS